MRGRCLTFIPALLLVACAPASPTLVPGPAARSRIQPLDAVLADARTSPCVGGLHPIPATVIGEGIFRNVPYQSFSNGPVELNAYGDPEDLVGLEVGTGLPDEFIQRCLIGFLSQQVNERSAGDAVRRLTLVPQTIHQGGLQVEVTPATAPDAYGAWWVSLEVPGRIAGAAATDAEMAHLAVERGIWSAPPAPPLATTGNSAPYNPPAQPYSSYRPSSGGPVFVHGYYRKNGSYVRSHSRRR